jgi:hypothetical protein
MKNIAENNLVRFVNIVKKKEGLFVNFKVKGLRAGVSFSASIAVDIAELPALDPATDSFETIVDECAKVALREFKKTELQFEGLHSL